MQLAEACLNCHYWRELHGDGEYGRCYRHAPGPQVDTVDIRLDDDPNFIFITHWPETHFSDWCGEMKFNFKTEVPE